MNLGVALQLTNIMRDLRTDAERGRIYLRSGRDPAVRVLRRTSSSGGATRRRSRADAIPGRPRARVLPRGPGGPAAGRPAALVAAEIMGGIYRALLRQIEARQFRVFDSRIRVSTPKKIALALGDLPARASSPHEGGRPRRPPARSASRTRPARRIGPGELLLRVLGCGLCGSDLAKLRGPAAQAGGPRVTRWWARWPRRGRGRGLPARASGWWWPTTSRARPATTAGAAASRCAGPSRRRTSIRAASPSTCRVPAGERAPRDLPRARPGCPTRWPRSPSRSAAASGRSGGRRWAQGTRSVVAGLGAMGCLLLQVARGARGARRGGRPPAGPPGAGRGAGGRAAVASPIRRRRRSLGLSRGARRRRGRAGGRRRPALVRAALGWVRDGGAVHLFVGEGEGPVPFGEVYRRELTLTATYSSSPADLAEAFDLLRTRRGAGGRALARTASPSSAWPTRSGSWSAARP